MTVIMLTVPVMMMWGQEMNKKFSMTTKMFMNELQEQKEQKASGKRRAPATSLPKPQRLIASPDTIGGVAYISCFIHLSDPSDLSAVRDLGVRVQETFDGLDFVTASVPVNQLEALADVDNVTTIEVSQLMRPMSNVARLRTNVDDVLTTSANAATLGISSQYDGTGVVLGIVDTGIDFQHIAFKDKNGNSRIKRAYVYNGTGSGVIYKDADILTVTTDDDTQDHGTHVASTAGGSSVIVDKKANDNFTITVTDDHANATYGGMAPGADLYLAGVKGLQTTMLMNAIKKIVEYADSVGKPVVVSNSWGTQGGSHDGTGTTHSFVSKYFGDTHPNHIILFAASNDAGHTTGSEGGGFFVKKSSASQASPLGTILRTDGNGGNSYVGVIASAWAASKLNSKLYVLSNTTGEIMKSWTITKDTSSFDGLDGYYTGSMTVYVGEGDSKYYVAIISYDGLMSTTDNAYTLAIEVYPEATETTADINMWAGGASYFTDHLTTADHSWTNGTDDMCVSDEATSPDAISVGAYVSRYRWPNYEGHNYHYTTQNPEGDIATFSSYATAEMSPTGQAYPWITAPGAAVVAGVNHYHTTEVDDYSYFGEVKASQLVVNNASAPYGMMQGTSMATPVAAGIVALWLQAANAEGKTLTVNQVKELMRLSAINDAYTSIGANASHFGNGKIDALVGLYAINGGLLLADNAHNSKKIAAAAETDKTYKVILAGRTLYKDGAWNTLCLPFDVTLEGSPLEGATVKKLIPATSNLSGTTLTLNFEDETTKMTAGTPYIIKWDKAEGYDAADPDTRDLTNPTFNNVTISNASSTEVDFTCGQFQGTYDPIVWKATNTSILFLGVNNQNESTLYYPQPDLSDNNNPKYPYIKGQRAYFQLSDDTAPVRQFVLRFAEDPSTQGDHFEDEPTGILSISKESGSQGADGEWYDMQGRKVTLPTKPGLYIRSTSGRLQGKNNRRKVAIK